MRRVGRLVALGVALGAHAGRPVPGAPSVAGDATPSASAGSAAGYLDDALCADCHGDLAASYEAEVGMARSFGRPRPETRIEDFASARFTHAPSAQHFELQPRGDGLVFRRWQTAPDGRPIHVLELPVDFWLGSGHRARVYLYRTPGGELFQLPLAWYTQQRRWGMAPGFDRRDHEGVLRRVRRECLFCHNAYPEVPRGADARDAPHTFPAHLPEGLGCQRCHGPGARHVARLRDEEARAERQGSPLDLAAVRAAIVNPGRLEPRLRDDVCFGCHMQPALALPGVRRLGRSDWSFRPGEPLPDYLAQVDADYADEPRAERFEINHHAYRLRQSRCFTASGGRLSCLTCHNPHRKPPAAARTAHYRAACLTCHDTQACRTHAQGPGAQDCVACHMPPRRPHDVVHVVMTDHRIQRRAPPAAERLAPRAEREPLLTGVELLEPARVPAAEAELYRVWAVVTSYGSASALDRLEALLRRSAPDSSEPWLALAEGQLKQRRFAAAAAVLATVLQRRPKNVRALEWSALASAGLGHHAEAIAGLRALETRGQAGPEALFNLGRILLGVGRASEAVPVLQRALEQRSNLVPAWFHLGRAHDKLGRCGEAVTAYERALAFDPAHAGAALELGHALVRCGRTGDAVRVWGHARQVLADPLAVAAALEQLQRHSPRR